MQLNTGCPSGWTAKTTMCYFIPSESGTFDQALDKCVALTNGFGELAEIHDASSRDDVESMYSAKWGSGILYLIR